MEIRGGTRIEGDRGPSRIIFGEVILIARTVAEKVTGRGQRCVERKARPAPRGARGTGPSGSLASVFALSTDPGLDFSKNPPRFVRSHPHRSALVPKIGRASCRERV